MKEVMPGPNPSEQQEQLPPPKKAGDVYIIVGALLGVVLGGAVGFLVSGGIGGLFITILCTAGGSLIGGTVGAWLGEKVEKRATRQRGSEGDKADD